MIYFLAQELLLESGQKKGNRDIKGGYMIVRNFLLLILTVSFFASCGHRKDAKAVEDILERETGQDFKIEKLNTAEGGDWVVLKNKTTGEFVAYNMKNFDRDTMTTLAQFEAAVGPEGTVNNLDKSKEWVESGYWDSVYDTVTYEDEYYSDSCDCYLTDTWTESYYVGEVWVDTSYYDNFYYGGGYRFENSSGGSKDLETLAALDEDLAQKFVAAKLGSEYSLSKNRSAELAKLVTRYSKLENARELTSSEKDEFALKALGVSYSSIENALKEKSEGKAQNFESLLEKAAAVNQTTTENIGSLIEQFSE